MRNYRRAQSQGHHTADRLENRGAERGSVRRSSSKVRERAVISQTNFGTVSKDEKVPSSVRPTLELFQRTSTGRRQSDQLRHCFNGRERAVVSQTNFGTVSKDEKGLPSVRPTLELFQRMTKGRRQSDQHWNCFKGRERATVSQTNVGTVSKDEK